MLTTGTSVFGLQLGIFLAGGGSVTPPAPGNILLETGDALLLESGDNLLKETV